MGASGIVAAALILLVDPGPDFLSVVAGGRKTAAVMQWAAYAASASAALDLMPLGAGIGAFASSFEVYGSSPIPHAWSSSHSAWLQGLVGMGLPFLAVLAVTVVVAILAARGILALAGIGIGEGERRTLDRVGSGSPTRSIVAGLRSLSWPWVRVRRPHWRSSERRGRALRLHHQTSPPAEKIE